MNSKYEMLETRHKNKQNEIKDLIKMKKTQSNIMKKKFLLIILSIRGERINKASYVNRKRINEIISAIKYA